MTTCPSCGAGIDHVIAAARSAQAKAAHAALMASTTAERRREIARKAGAANGRRPEADKAATRERQAVALRAYWSSPAGVAQRARLSAARRAAAASTDCAHVLAVGAHPRLHSHKPPPVANRYVTLRSNASERRKHSVSLVRPKSDRAADFELYYFRVVNEPGADKCPNERASEV
jgi:uncharacterized protein (DUF2384 family)